MRVDLIAWPFILVVLALVACSDPETARRLAAEIALVEAKIAEARVDRAQYGEGSILHALVSLRLHMYEQTRAMLEQKKTAAWYFPRFTYTVDGRVYEPPADLSVRIADLDARLQAAISDTELAETKAAGTGGLLGALAAMEVETKRLLISQLEYQKIAYESGFPPYIAPETEDSTAGALQPTASTTTQPLTVPAAPSRAVQEREALQNALSVRLINKTYVPSDFRARRYDDRVALEFEYENRTERDIRAFTGTVIFKDIFDRPFLRVNLTVDDPIGAGQTVRDSDKSLATNQFDADHQKLIATDLANLRLGFEVESILFMDGTRLGDAPPN